MEFMGFLKILHPGHAHLDTTRKTSNGRSET